MAIVVVLQGDTPSPDPTRFHEAVAAWRAKVPMTKAAWDALTQAERQRAFTVAGVAQVRLLSDVWNALDAAIERGETFEEFKAKIGDKLRKAWGGEEPSHLETVFRTNIQTAYSHGRYAQMTDPVTMARRPFWKYSAVQDGRTTEVCKPLGGTILPADSPFWNTHCPPLHFNCRSTIIALSKVAAERQGISKDEPDVEADEGFGLAPGKGGETPKPDLSTVPEPLRKVVEKALPPPPPPPPPPAVSRAPATTQKAHEELSRRARELLGEKLYNHEVVSTDKLDVPDALGARNVITGRIGIRPDFYLQLDDLFRRAAAGETLTGADADAFHVLMHEELHGLGKWKKAAADMRSGVSELTQAIAAGPTGRALEEGAVELASVLRQRKVAVALGLDLPEATSYWRKWDGGKLTGMHSYPTEVGLVETLCHFAAGTAKATAGATGDLTPEGHQMLDGMLYRWNPLERVKTLVGHIVQRNTPASDHLRVARAELLERMVVVYVDQNAGQGVISRSVWDILRTDAAGLRQLATTWRFPVPEGL